MSQTIASNIIDFNHNLIYDGALPDGFDVMNPFLENPETMQIMAAFYHKYYNDDKKRKFIVGINPGRHGAGATGIPFTDTKRLEAFCGIKMESVKTHEVSSVFVYDVIEAYGGPAAFYSNFYINSPFPLAITRQNKAGKWVNANYYDDNLLFEMTKEFMIDSMQKHLALGLDTSEVIVLGKKNAKFMAKLNKEANLFDKMIVLDHPRYIQQYKFKERGLYIDGYLQALAPKDF